MARVRYFAAAEEAAGTAAEVRAEGTLGALRAGMLAAYPALTSILPRCAVLVDGVRTEDDTAPIGSEATVDVLPPFAGG